MIVHCCACMINRREMISRIMAAYPVPPSGRKPRQDWIASPEEKEIYISEQN
ncbi:MAG: hypothetical protein ACOY40_10750 [Bacillota bacterium]